MSERARGRVLSSFLYLCACAPLGGCGDPLVSTDYKGEPLLRVEGNIVLQDNLASQDLGSLGRLQVALFWLSSLQPSADTLSFRAEAGGVAQGLASPARYAFDLYHPPSDAALITMPDTTQQVGLALVLLFDDLNGDGLRQDDEPFVGGTRDMMLLYTASSLTSDLISEPLAPGFHLLSQALSTSGIGASSSSPPACLTDSAAAAFTRLATTDQVDLDLDFIDNPWQRVPDVNCDGSAAEWCEEVRPFIDLSALPTPEHLIERICYTPQPERAEILAAYTLCQSQLQETDPCLPDFSRCDDPAMQSGPPLPTDHPLIEYFLCRHPQLNHDGCAELVSLSEPDLVLRDPIGLVMRACTEAASDPSRFAAFTDAYRRCMTDPCFTDEVVALCSADASSQPPPTGDVFSAYLDCIALHPENMPNPSRTNAP